MRKVSGLTLIELLIVMAILIILVAVLSGGSGSISISDGNRTGQITKLSHKGIYWTTWEGELLVGGLRSGSVANVWQFSVIDSSIIEQLRKAMDESASVNLHYRQVFFIRPWNGATTYYVDSVTILRPSP